MPEEQPQQATASLHIISWSRKPPEQVVPVLRIKKDILKFQVPVDDLLAMNIVHLGCMRFSAQNFPGLTPKSLSAIGRRVFHTRNNGAT